SPQGLWLKQELEQKHKNGCVLAYFHKPLFSSGGSHGNDPLMKPLWQILYHAGADVVINGHDHDYERFAPQDPEGKADPAHGIREFVVGSGGKNTHRVFSLLPRTTKTQTPKTSVVLNSTLNPKT